MKYLVTGGAGFIGSHIVEELVRRGEQVRVLDNFSTGKRENLALFLNKIELIEGDLCDLSVCERAVAGVDYVLHQAALPSVPRSVRDPIASNAANTTATLSLLWASRGKVGRFVYASSSSVYGNNRELPKREDQPTLPMSPYAISKLAGEQYAHVFHELYGLETVCLRYFNVFGPRQDPASEYAAVIPRFILWLRQGKPVAVFGDGEQSRDFTYVANVVQANLLACAAPGAVGRVFNVAAGKSTTVNGLAASIASQVGASLRIEQAPPRPGEIRASWADISAARRSLGYEPTVGIDEGISRTIEWFRSGD